MNRKNKILPFEEESSIEFLSKKNDCSLFFLGTHSKKRPDNLTIGRLFDYHILDIMELGITNYKGMSEFPTTYAPKEEMRPCFVFCGSEWESDEKLAKLRNLLIDIFRGRAAEMINLDGLEHAIICTAASGLVHFRHYAILLKKSGTTVTNFFSYLSFETLFSVKKKVT